MSHSHKSHSSSASDVQSGGEARELQGVALGVDTALSETADIRIIDSARERLAKHPHLTTQRIWCEYASGRLLLSGQVPSFYYKQLAQEAMMDLGGVCQVVNDIEVVW